MSFSDKWLMKFRFCLLYYKTKQLFSNTKQILKKNFLTPSLWKMIGLFSSLNIILLVGVLANEIRSLTIWWRNIFRRAQVFRNSFFVDNGRFLKTSSDGTMRVTGPDEVVRSSARPVAQSKSTNELPPLLRATVRMSRDLPWSAKQVKK